MRTKEEVNKEMTEAGAKISGLQEQRNKLYLEYQTIENQQILNDALIILTSEVYYIHEISIRDFIYKSPALTEQDRAGKVIHIRLLNK